MEILVTADQDVVILLRHDTMFIGLPMGGEARGRRDSCSSDPDRSTYRAGHGSKV